MYSGYPKQYTAICQQQPDQTYAVQNGFGRVDDRAQRCRVVLQRQNERRVDRWPGQDGGIPGSVLDPANFHLDPEIFK